MRLLFLTAAIALFSCNTSDTPSSQYPTIGHIETIDERFKDIIREDAVIEVIASGFVWTEGPLWVDAEQMLLFSDIPPNSIYKWTEDNGAELYLKPSGYTGEKARSGEPGSNGLLLNASNQLVLCQHGDRRMAVMNASLKAPEPNFETVVAAYEGKKLNSPNDAIYNSHGDLFFTDPPYGLEGNVDDPAKELPFQGVYKFNKNGELKLLVDTLTRPNGIALTADEKSFVIGNSDAEKGYLYQYNLHDNDSVSFAGILYDATALYKTHQGSIDGLKIDEQGNIFTTVPGGVVVLNKEGNLLGKFNIPQACSNVALANGGKTLYITANHQILRIKMR